MKVSRACSKVLFCLAGKMRRYKNATVPGYEKRTEIGLGFGIFGITVVVELVTTGAEQLGREKRGGGG